MTRPDRTMDRSPGKGTLGWAIACIWGFAVAGVMWELSDYVRKHDWLEIRLVIPYAPAAILVDPNDAMLNCRYIHFFALANWVAIFLLGALVGWCRRRGSGSTGDVIPTATDKPGMVSWATICAALFVAARFLYHAGLLLPRLNEFRAASRAPFAPLFLLAGRRIERLEMQHIHFFALASWAGTFLLGRVFLRLEKRRVPGASTARLWLATGSALLGGVLYWQVCLTLLDVPGGQLHSEYLRSTIVVAYAVAALATFALIRAWRDTGRTATAYRITHLAYLAVFAVAAVIHLFSGPRVQP